MVALANALGAASGSAVGTFSISPSAVVPAGRLLIAYAADTTGNGIGISDSGGNVYRSLMSQAGTSSLLALAAAEVVTALTTSSTLTMRQAAGSSVGAPFLGAASFTGLRPDAPTKAYGLQTVTSSPGGSLSVVTAVKARDLAIATLFSTSSTERVNYGAWTPLSSATRTSSGFITAAFQVPSATGAITWAPSANTTGDCLTGIIAFPADQASLTMLV